MSHHYLLAGARGGQGTTTLATVLAVLAAGHGPTMLYSEQADDVLALSGRVIDPGWPSPSPICPNLTLSTYPSTVGDLVDRLPSRDSDGDADQRTCDLAPKRSKAGRLEDTHTVVSDLGRLTNLVDTEEASDQLDETRWLVIRGPCYLSLRAAASHSWRPDGIVLVSEPGRSLTAADVSDVLGVPVVVQVPVDPAVARVVDAGLLLDRLHRLNALRGLAELLRLPMDPETAAGAQRSF